MIRKGHYRRQSAAFAASSIGIAWRRPGLSLSRFALRRVGRCSRSGKRDLPEWKLGDWLTATGAYSLIRIRTGQENNHEFLIRYPAAITGAPESSSTSGDRTWGQRSGGLAFSCLRKRTIGTRPSLAGTASVASIAGVRSCNWYEAWVSHPTTRVVSPAQAMGAGARMCMSKKRSSSTSLPKSCLAFGDSSRTCLAS